MPFIGNRIKHLPGGRKYGKAENDEREKRNNNAKNRITAYLKEAKGETGGDLDPGL
jgi:hypothetical protein